MDGTDRAAGDPQQDAGDFHDAPTEMDAGPSEAVPDDSAPDEPRLTYPGGLQRLANRYELEEPIASGGAAIVWRAFDDVLSRSVAIKLLHPHLAGDPTTVERFRLESINAARLAHTNVVQIYDTGQQQDVVFLVMEYVDGPSLRDVLRSRGPMDPEVVAALGEQVASALGEAHSQGVVHRDVKPANILLTTDGVAKVTDFGIAKALSGNQATLTNPGTVVGTAAYVAPEQLEGGPVDARADVYALGVVLHECLTGKPAFQGDTPTATAAARLTQDLLPPRQLRADVPRTLDDVVVRATRRDPDRRFPDGSAMATALQALVRSKPSDVTAALLDDTAFSETAAPVESPTTRDSGPVDRVPDTRGEYGRRLLAAFVGGLLLALVAFLATQALRSDDPTGATAGEAIPVATAGAFDPHGTDGENDETAMLAVDGDTETEWRTETYRAPFSELGKPGVGLWVDLAEPRSVEAVALVLDIEGADVEILAQEGMPDLDDETEEAWTRVAAREAVASEDRLVVDATSRWWLIWFTGLPATAESGYGLGVRELRFIEAE